MIQYRIRVNHEKFGVVLDENFVNATQFKLFLRMIQGCIELKNDLTFFNGTDFLVHIPHSYLVNSIITTNVEDYSLTDHIVLKSKIEALETR